MDDGIFSVFWVGFNYGMWLCSWVVGFLTAVLCTLGASFVGIGVGSFCVNKIREIGIRKQFDASSVKFVSADDTK